MRRLHGLLLAGATLAIVVPAAQAGSPGTNGQIALMVNTNSQFNPGRFQRFYDLGMAVPGGAITRLTFTNEKIEESGPSWSPSGDRLAFTRSRPGRPSQVFVLNADGTGLTRVSRGTLGASDPTWSPDGSQIAFVRQDDIWVMNADGSHAHALTVTPAIETDPAWAPKGSRIAFTDVTSYPSQVWTMDEDGSNRVDITPPDTEDSTPDWSPDGSRLALARRTVDERAGGDGDGLVTVAADGSDARTILPADYHVGSDEPAWSPDGQSLAFVAGGFGICFVDTVTLTADGSFGGFGAAISGDVFGSGSYCDQDPTWQPLPDA